MKFEWVAWFRDKRLIKWRILKLVVNRHAGIFVENKPSTWPDQRSRDKAHGS